MADKLTGLWGLARRAGKVVFGAQAVRKGVFEGGIRLVFIADDASPRTREDIGRICSEKNVPVVVPGYTMEQIGSAIGRSETAVLGLTDESFSNRAAAMCHAN